MPQLARRAALAVALLLLLPLSTLSTTQASDPAPVAGSSGVGDSYYPLDGNGGYDVQHYDVRDTYRSGTDDLTGTTELTATATESLSSFDLDLLLATDSVEVDGEAATFRRSGSHELVVTPATPVVAGSDFVVRVAYHGRPSSLTYRREAAWQEDEGEATATDEPHMAPWWFAANDHPRDKATYDITLTVPSGQQVISNGVLVDHPTADGLSAWHWRMDQPMAGYLAFVAIGQYRIEQGTYHGRPWLNAVSRLYDRRDQNNALKLMRNTGPMVSWLEKQFGPYPFDTMGGVVTGIYRGFALENQSRPTYPLLGNGHGARSVVLHELAHQWFGDDVSVDRWRDIWLNEGFATWAEWRYDETHGGPTAQKRLRSGYADRPASRRFWKVRVANPGEPRLFDEAVYERGAMTLQALRHRIGPTRFQRLLRTWVTEHHDGNARIGQFEALAEQVGGQQLDRFFQAWLHSGTRPPHTRRYGF